MTFKRILMALSIGLALASPVVAKESSEWEVLAARAGCPVPVTSFYDPEEKAFNAGYSEGNWFYPRGIYIWNFDTIPATWQLYIFYHEVGHCLQYRNGQAETLRASSTATDFEWDADEYAIKKLAEHGFDGAEIQAEAFAYILQLYPDASPDDAHGDYRERLQNGRLKRAYSDTQR